MHDTTPLVREDHEDEQESARSRRHDEEVGRGDLLKMVCKERSRANPCRNAESSANHSVRVRLTIREFEISADRFTADRMAIECRHEIAVCSQDISSHAGDNA